MSAANKKQFRVLIGINYGPDDTRLEPGDLVDVDFVNKKQVDHLLSIDAIEEHDPKDRDERKAAIEQADEKVATPTTPDSTSVPGSEQPSTPPEA